MDPRTGSNREASDAELTRYLALIDRVQSRPENQPGVDKTWVERAMRDYQQHYRRAKRLE
jgi:hypothetical protein